MANPVSSRMRGRWRLALFVTGILSLSTALAGGHKAIGPRVEPEVPDEVRTGVTAIVEETANRWNSQDYATLLGLWDPAEAYPTYLAEEQAEWFVGWDRLRRYLDPPRRIPVLEAIRMFAEDVCVKQIAPDLAIGMWNWHFETSGRRARAGFTTIKSGRPSRSSPPTTLSVNGTRSISGWRATA